MRGWLLGASRRETAARFLAAHQHNMLFVMGGGRSGTQLVAALLNASGDAAVFHEPDPVEDVENMDRFRRNHDLTVDYWRLYRNVRVYERWQESDRKSVYGEVNGMIRYQTPAIMQLYPRAQYYLLVRDGRGVVRSVMGRPQFYAPDASGAYALEPLSGDPYAAQWGRMSRFEKICWSWRDTHIRLMRDIPRSHWLQLERLSSDYAYCRERLLQPGGLDIARNTWESHVSRPSPNSSTAYGFPAWQDWSASEKATFDRICGDVMSDLGYGQD